ncbi:MULTISPECIES: molecular chaperone TorD [Citrobacter]|jgi:TorA-specific chaperone|uniref:molecular chaperone TorD n=1 Tax=Citrobacter TaxID=544 RepID=UPI0011EF4DAE|nr:MULTISPECIES: molecular chaperone TorD [Citrobacter]MBA8560792.1 molecular chaperone TorD [Citrobacter freundii]MBD0804014.1 molecular chaperone TorD [Citrobacter sp. C13]NUE70723.1 molecular chaperone TorD [Escherichia coli]KAA0545658.1 molecular chaperone TorD [Citrobacter portucalensis]MBI1677252.1 molecular chaperone TorD [Citrobacter portucalensis]
MIKDTSLTTEQMACVYAWLAQMFSQERDGEGLAQLQSSEMAEWFAVLKGEPLLEAQVLQLEAKIAALKVREDATLELAADFCSLFLMSDKHAALPYASAHLEEGPNYGVIKQLLSDAGMQVSDTFSESADHLAIFIELLSHLHFSLGEPGVSRQRIDALRRETLAGLLRWLPEFTTKCRRYDDFGFYGALSQLLLAFVRLDHQN